MWESPMKFHFQTFDRHEIIFFKQCIAVHCATHFALDYVKLKSTIRRENTL